MYDVSVPVMVTAPTFNKEAVLKDLKLVGAKRVLLAIPFSSHDETVMEGYYEKQTEPEKRTIDKSPPRVG